MKRWPEAVGDEDAYRVMRQHGLLQKKRRVREPELYQALKRYELLPQRPNDLWQMDVTYLHIPGFGWWFAVTAIDYYSRYLLACHLTNSYSAIEAIHALGLAREEAERLHGPLGKMPFLVTDNGSSHRGQRSMQRLAEWYPNAVQVHTPVHASWLNQVEIFFSVVQRAVLTPNDFSSLAEAEDSLLRFQTRYEQTAQPFK